MTNSLTIYSIRMILKGTLAKMQDYTKNSNNLEKTMPNKQVGRIDFPNLISEKVEKSASWVGKIVIEYAHLFGN